jgi:hypothetical protein
MDSKLVTLCAFIAVPSLSACQRGESLVDVGSRLSQQPIQVVHYGDDGALARIEGNAGLYGVIFDPSCQGCKLAEETIQPASVYDISLCEFSMTVSGDIEKMTRKSLRTLRVKRVDQQPKLEAGHVQEKSNQPCKRPPLSGTAKPPNV